MDNDEVERTNEQTKNEWSSIEFPPAVEWRKYIYSFVDWG